MHEFNEKLAKPGVLRLIIQRQVLFLFKVKDKMTFNPICHISVFSVFGM